MFRKFITFVLLLAFSLSIVSPALGVEATGTTTDMQTVSDQAAAASPLDILGDVLTSAPANTNKPVPYIKSVSASLNLNEYKTEAELRQAILGDEKWLEQFPNGLFNFVGTQWQINETNTFLEIPVVRQGGTKGAATVDFKAIDVSAEYGRDYVIRVYENSQRAEMAKNEAAVPLMQTIGDNASVNISDIAKEKTASQSDTSPESSESADTPTPITDSSSVSCDSLVVPTVNVDNAALNSTSQVHSSVYNTAYEPISVQSPLPTDTPYTDLTGSMVNVNTGSGKPVKSLREARETYLGQKSDRPDWKTADQGQVEELKVAYDQYIKQVPGVQTTLTFADGEYIKYLYLVPLDDTISESEEQIMFALENPTGGGSRGEFYMGYVNIVDNEAPEPCSFEISTPTVTAENGLATIIVKRTGGLQQNASIVIGTEEGTAASGVDYEPGLEELFFTPGMSEQRVTVNVLDNPARDTGRQFTIALDRTSQSVNQAATEAVVTIPASAAGEKALSAQGVSEEATSRQVEAADESINNADSITPYGNSPYQGVWRITGEDFINNGIFYNDNFKPQTYSEPPHGTGMFYDYIGDSNAHNLYQEMGYDLGNLGGIDKIKYTYSNRPEGTDPNNDPYSMYFNINYIDAVIGWPRLNDLIELRGWTDFKKYEKTLREWLNKKSIGFAFTNREGYHSTPNINELQLVLKKYKIRVQQPENYTRNFFSIKDGKLVKADEKTYKPIEYSPGEFYISQVVSTVKNDRNEKCYEADVCRSDRINFRFTPNEQDNKGEWCVYCAGFQVKYGPGENDWKTYYDNTLVLNTDFFADYRMFNATYDGYIDVKPLLFRKQTNLEIKVDTSKGYLEGLRLDQGLFEKRGPDGTPWFFIGDTIADLWVHPGFKSRTPVWTAKAGSNENSLSSNDKSITIINGTGNTKANYLLTERYNKLSINFKSEFRIEANSYKYMDNISMPTYKLDGTEFNESVNGGKTKFRWDLFTDAIKQAFDDGKNPELEMEFKYKKDAGFPADQHAFGEPYGAILTVYSGDTILPRFEYKTYDQDQQSKNYSFIMSQDSSGSTNFKFTGKPKELGWKLSDYATVQLMGNNGASSSQPVTIDFLSKSNSRDGVIVQLIEGKKTKSYTGDILTPIVVNDVNPNGNYLMQGITSPAFMTCWQNMSADEDRNNYLSDEELNKVAQRLYDMSFNIPGRNLETYKALYDKYKYWNSYRFTPELYDPSIVRYYMQDISRQGTSLGTLNVTLTKKYDTVLNEGVFIEDPLKNTEVYFGSKQITDKGNGNYTDTDVTYFNGDYYLGQVNYQGNNYNFPILAGSPNHQCIQLTSAQRPRNFNKDNIPLKGDVVIENRNICFSYKIDPGTSGADAIDSCVRIYDKDDNLVLETYSGLPEKGVFSVNINPIQEHIKADCYMTVAGMANFTDIEGKPYPHQFPEVRVGFMFKNPPAPVYMMASYEAVNKVVKLFGQLNNRFDLGLNVDLDRDTAKLTDGKYSGKPTIEYDETIKEQQPDGTYKEVTRKRGFHTVTYGFSKDFKEKIEEKLVCKNTGGSDDSGGSGDDSGGDEDDPFASINDMVESDAKDKNKDDLGNSVKEKANDAVAVKSGGGDYLKFDISLALTWEKEYCTSNTSYYTPHYFRSLVIMATATPKTYTKERTWITPVGIPITIGLDISGSAVLVTSFEKPLKDVKDDPYNHKYNLEPEQKDDADHVIGGGVGFRPEEYQIYTKFSVYPTIDLRATAGTDTVSVTVKGSAKFSLNFNAPILKTTACGGSGSVKLSATVKAKFVCSSKEWTIYDGDEINLFNDGSSPQEVMLSALSNPYRNYQYEKLETIEDEDIIPRDYLSGKSAWNSHPGDKPHDVHLGYEVELEKGAYPYPQTRLIPVNDNNTLMLFIDDDTSRDARNRACLMYSIIDGVNSTPPIAIDNDGTWDESPSAFRVGDRILITWSDADRVFTKADTAKDLVKAMNISGIWFDTATGTLGQKFAITKTVAGDQCGDLNPVVSYNQDTGRLMVYYNKTDYEDRWTASQNISGSSYHAMEESPAPLYGDIINGYNVVTYRYADYDPAQADFVWNETYAPEEKLDPAQFYGQRFLDLTPLANIHEEEQEIPKDITLKGENGADIPVTVKRTVTAQTVEPYQGLKDPRIVGMDLTAFDGKAALAYVIDSDADLKTVADQQLYLQTYNYAANTFTSPLQITNNSVQNTQPRFVRLGDDTYLYWLEDGNIVYTSISDLLKNNGKLKEVTAPDSGKTFSIIDKTNSRKEAHISLAVDHTNYINEFKVASKEDTVYVLWPQDGISYKNGLKPGEPGTDDPANINKERQIFVACKVSDGTTDFPWTKPVQVTAEAGANYSDLSFIVIAPEYFEVAYSKYGQYYDSNTGLFTDDPVRNLGFRLFSITSDLKLGETTTDAENPQPNALVRASAVLSNTGLKAVKNPAYQFYVQTNGSTYYASEWYQNTTDQPFYIQGASDTTVNDCFYMPKTLDGIDDMKLGFRVKNEAGQQVASTEKTVTIQPDLDIKVLDSRLTAPSKAYIKLTVTNQGNKTFNDAYTISAGDKILYSEAAQIAAGEQKDIELEIDLGGAQFGLLSTTDEGAIYDRLALDIKFGDFKTSTDLIRLAPAAACNELQTITGFSLKNNGTSVQNGAHLVTNRGKVVNLETVITKSGEAASLSDEEKSRLNQLEVVWTSSNPGIVYPLAGDELAALSPGTATITATLQPKGKESIAYADGTIETFDKSYTLPDNVNKKISFTVSVGASSDSGSTPTSSGGSVDKKPEQKQEEKKPIKQNPANGSVQAAEKLEGSQLTLTMDDKSFAQTASQTRGMLIVNSAGGSGQLRQVSVVLTSGNLQSIAQSQVKGMVVNSTAGSVTLDRKALDAVTAVGPGKGATIELSVNEADVDVMIKADQSNVNQLKGGSMILSIPRAAKPGEDTNSIVVYDMSDAAAPKIIKTSVCQADGKLAFKTDKPGHYKIAYNQVEFKDNLGWAKDYISFLASRQVVSGIAPGIFAKDKTLTRAEFVTMLARLSGDIPADTSSSFTDVPNNAWYSRYVKWAHKNGIVNGTSAAKFSPDQAISREQMAVMLKSYISYAGMPLAQGSSGTGFKDKAAISSWSLEAVNALKAAGIMNGIGDNRFEPQKSASRAEAAKVLSDVLKMSVK